LLNGLLAWDARQADLPRAGIVHRLDKDTSGLMLVARTRSAMDALVRMIAQRDVQRQYLALALRPWTGASPRDVAQAIGRDPANRLRMATLASGSTGAKEARTTIELLDNGDPGCLVRCSLHTGRTHQIRVHMASIGHPLLGDTVYGAPPGSVIGRQALHAYRLALAHPLLGHALAFEAPVPPDMRDAMALWGLRYNPAR
jgi:23S rRNA pseudouridine1911/1915/1917 synthase